MTEQDLKKRFGANLLKLRRQLSMTQAQLAMRLGVSSSQIAKIESGKSGPSFGIMAKIMQVFNCSCVELFEGTEPVTPPDVVSSALQAIRASANCVEMFTRENQELKYQIKLLKSQKNLPTTEADSSLLDILRKTDPEGPGIPQVIGK